MFPKCFTAKLLHVISTFMYVIGCKLQILLPETCETGNGYWGLKYYALKVGPLSTCTLDKESQESVWRYKALTEA